MGRCARRTKKAIKIIWKTLSPAVLGFTSTVVGILAKTNWVNEEKRQTAYKLISAAYPEAKENAINAAIVLAVQTLKQGQAALEDLGAVDDTDEQEIEGLD